MFSNRYVFMMVVTSFSLALQACTFLVGRPKYHQYSIPISKEATQCLQQARVDSVAQRALSGEFSLRITEAHLTSIQAINLFQQNLVGAGEPAAPGEVAKQANQQEQITSIASMVWSHS
ncbi:MAG: hypothetical protein NT121_04450 [Chloroflexi bacterium]|nr:hypothetical protein [Chloroflexota bacterium]